MLVPALAAIAGHYVGQDRGVPPGPQDGVLRYGLVKLHSFLRSHTCPRGSRSKLRLIGVFLCFKCQCVLMLTQWASFSGL